MEISIAVLDAIATEATASTDEVCGLLLGSSRHDEGVTSIVEHRCCRNVATDPARHFEIDPTEVFAAHRAARDGGPMILGHYHSHPSGDTRPSVTDAAMAAPDGAIWLIVAGNRIGAWRAVHDGAVHARFDRVELIVR